MSTILDPRPSTLFDLGDDHRPAVNSRGVSVSPWDQSAETPPSLSPAGGGNVRTSQSLALRGTIIDHACDVVIKELLNLYGDDVPCVRKFRRYLETLSLEDLLARRDLFLEERRPMQLELGRYMLNGGGEL